MTSRRTAVFTLSLDCEGFWGVADSPAAIARWPLNDQSLSKAYNRILHVLENNGVRATAAFVTCFAAEFEMLAQCRPLLEALEKREPDWFQAIGPMLRGGSREGWHGAMLYQRFLQAGHEIGWHGSTHLPLGSQRHPESVAIELELTSQLFEALGHRPRTIVFPRNQVGHLACLRQVGFTGYRAGVSAGRIQSLSNLLAEFNPLPGFESGKPQRAEGWGVAPPGHFLNWPHGIRACVPPALTIRRWCAMINQAISSGGYVHMWFHPHNLITAPSMVDIFESIIQHVGLRVRAGEMIALTMQDSFEFYQVQTS